jgi:DNA polymerase-3 subunit epsilon
VLALDCQASGASPAHGDLLSLAWGMCGPLGMEGAPENDWIVPRSKRRISRAVRELTGFQEAHLAHALREDEAWQKLCAACDALSARTGAAVPTVIHFARFELSFLRDLHARLSPDRPFPLEVVCVHEIATRLLPELPRRGIRALAGHLGHSLELTRDAGGHVRATAFIFRALLPLLAERSVSTWQELSAWLSSSARPPRPLRRSYPLPKPLRRALSVGPGVYRFVRSNGDVLYVGKAASVRARVASHFSGHARENERSLEMLTQVADVVCSETPSVLEAALLECDEIKRLDPPYNIHLRATGRSTFFATRDLGQSQASVDSAHTRGPLPSPFAVAALFAITELCNGAEATAELRALTLGVPRLFVPDEALFREGLSAFLAAHLELPSDGARRAIEQAARALFRARGLREAEPGPEDRAPDTWDLARVERRLARNVVQAGLVLRRARWLCLLANADVLYREREMAFGRALIFADGQVQEQRDLAVEARPRARGRRTELSLADIPQRKARAALTIKARLEIAAYDRLRVLATELRRVRDEGGEVLVRCAGHVFTGERLARLTRDV